MQSMLRWMFLFFGLDGYTPPNIQPQPALRPENKPWHEIITGVYREPPLLKIHDRRGTVRWSWERFDVTQDLPPGLKRCLYSSADDATDIKWMANGTSVAAIYSDLVMVLNHTPDDPSTDKSITFAVCCDNEFLWNAHSVEPLPGERLAIGTTGQRPWDGILVYNASRDAPLTDNPHLLQNITGLRAIHGLIWDEHGQMLWAAGTDYAADGSDDMPARGVIRGYPFDSTTGRLREDQTYFYSLSRPQDMDIQWGKNYSWWAGPHDLVPVPNKRKFLMSDDRGLHEFDIESGRFVADNEEVIRRYMKGFEVTTDERHGYNRDGGFEDLPLSDLKSFSLAPDGSFIYVQALWQEFRGMHTSLVARGLRHMINKGDEIYRSRWFGDIDGWPKPKQ